MKRRGVTLAEVIVAMGILAIWSVPIIFTSQKALQNSALQEEVQRSYEHAQTVLERAASLATEPQNWDLFDETTDGDGDEDDGTAVYHYAAIFDYTRDESNAAELDAYDNPRQIRPHDASDQVKVVTEDRGFVTHIDVDPVFDSTGTPSGLSLVTVSVYRSAPGNVPLPSTNERNNDPPIVMSTYVRRIGS